MADRIYLRQEYQSQWTYGGHLNVKTIEVEKNPYNALRTES